MNQKNLTKDYQQYELSKLLKEMPIRDVAEVIRKVFVKEDKSMLEVLIVLINDKKI